MQFSPFIPLLLASISVIGTVLVTRSAQLRRRDAPVRIERTPRRR